MKTFFKILLVVVLLIVAIKLSPIILIGAFIGLVVAGILGAVGLSLLAVILALALGVTLALSPIWLPVLVVMGLISLFRKDAHPMPPPAPAAAA